MPCLLFVQRHLPERAGVLAGVLEDTMESFFLSETAKYLYLLAANATEVGGPFRSSLTAVLLQIRTAAQTPLTGQSLQQTWMQTNMCQCSS